MPGGPRFVTCSVCRRQIMPHSLAIHEAKCLEKWCMENKNAPNAPTTTAAGTGAAVGNKRANPSVNKQQQQQPKSSKPPSNKPRLTTTAVVRPTATVPPQFQVVGNKTAITSATRPTPQSLQAKSQVTLESTIIEVRTVANLDTRTPTASPLMVQRYRRGSVDEKRPGTVTLSPVGGGRATSLDRAAAGGANATRDETALCYVCGQRCARSSIESHEKKCLHIWQCLVAKLPPAIRVYKPQKLQHPSVDGTIDPTRSDSLALASSQRSQKVDCSRCRKTGIDLLTAREHVRQCGTKKPERPVKTDGKGAANKSKRKKTKEREIFVSIFA